MIATALAAFLVVSFDAQTRFLSYQEAQGSLAALTAVLPAELNVSAADAEVAWPKWAQRHDRDVRARLQRGDEETIVNWLLFGTSFTKLPRIAPEGAAGPAEDAERAKLIAGRATDLAGALAAPGSDERRLFARQLFSRQGYATATAADRARLADHLIDLVFSVTSERTAIAREGQAIRQLPQVSDQFVARSRLFRERGLSLDTLFTPGFALEQTLTQLRDRGLLKPGAIRDVAVIGPGLDFTDKASGVDLYPQQTLQPFALIDSLIRVGLVRDASVLRLTTLDISPRVNDHLRRARTDAAAGQPYRVRLPKDPKVPWKPALLDYWRTAGDRIGTAGAPVTAEAAGTTLDVRTVSIRPAVTLRIDALDLNIVLQRSEQHRFDLVVATNVFIYYDVPEQVLALSNVKAMLKPGGFLLSNNALLELPSSGIHSVGYSSIEYSNRPDDGDHIVWYRLIDVSGNRPHGPQSPTAATV